MKIIFLSLSILFSAPVFAENSSLLHSYEKTKLPRVHYLNELNSFWEDLSHYKISSLELEQNLNEIFQLGKEHTFDKQRAYTDDLGVTHTSYKHYYKGQEVYNELLLVHSKNGIVESINGQISSFENVETNMTISDKKVLEIAQRDFYSTLNTIVADTGSLVFRKVINGKLSFVAAKKIWLHSIAPAKSLVYYIANDGEILFIESKMKDASVNGTGLTLNRGVQNIVVESFEDDGATKYKLLDTERKIATKDASSIFVDQNMQMQGEIKDAVSNTPNFTSPDTKSMVEIHWGMAKTYDYYKNIHNRDSYDGLGSEIANVYGLFSAKNNAMAYPAVGGNPPFMIFGKGTSGVMKDVVALDVAGHEYTHHVIDRNGHGGLTYAGESGAINESFADMFGTSIEFYTNLSPNWTIGEHVIDNPGAVHFRNLTEPKQGAFFYSALGLIDMRQPDTYEGELWADTQDFEKDYGGVHINSGVGNKWFYLISMGGSGTNDLGYNYNVTNALGINKAEKIAYHTLVNYLTPSATYIDFRNASIKAAKELYGDQAAQVVSLAWDAVNVKTNSYAQTKNELEQKITIYPNPVSNNQLTVTVNTEETVSLQIYNTLGSMVKNVELQSANNTIDISDMNKGVYILKFQSQGKEFSTKLMVN